MIPDFYYVELKFIAAILDAIGFDETVRILGQKYLDEKQFTALLEKINAYADYKIRSYDI